MNNTHGINMIERMMVRTPTRCPPPYLISNTPLPGIRIYVVLASKYYKRTRRRCARRHSSVMRRINHVMLECRCRDAAILRSV